MTRPLTIALTVTVVFSMLPASWLARLGDVGAIVNFPLEPLRHGAGKIAEWLQPPDVAEHMRPEDESVDDLFQQKEQWRRRYMAAELRIRKLESDLRQLQLVPVNPFGLQLDHVIARITGRPTARPGDAVSVNRGSRHGVDVGAIAVVDGIYLVGYVVTVDAVRCSVVPLTAKVTGPLHGRVRSASVDAAITDAPLIQLFPEGDGTFTADPARDIPLEVGDRIYLDDPNWPVAQAMVVGQIVSIEPEDEAPLRHRVIVRPVHRLHRLRSVTLVMPTAGDAEAAP